MGPRGHCNYLRLCELRSEVLCLSAMRAQSPRLRPLADVSFLAVVGTGERAPLRSKHTHTHARAARLHHILLVNKLTQRENMAR